MKRTAIAALGVALGMTAWLAAAPATAPVADASMKGDATALRTLLKSGADVNASEPDGMTALHWAAERGDAALADMLLVAGASPSAVTRIGGYTPLHIAAETGSGPVVRALLKKGANAKSADSSGATPLHLAAKSGSADATLALIEAGADVN